MAEIPLTQGKVALVDDEDYEQLAGMGTWFAYHGCGRAWYAKRNLRLPDGKRTIIAMHQVIMGSKGIDHVNGDGLDNRRENLRPATRNQNAWNRGRNRNNSTGYKGVKRYRQGYVASIGIGDYQRIHLGVFRTAEEAAHAYAEAARIYHGEFAHT